VLPTVAAEPATVNASGPSSAEPGETVTVSVTLTNSGQNDSGYIADVSVPNDWTVTSYTDDSGFWNGDDRSWLWQTISPGDSVTPAVTVGIPTDETSGSYAIEAVAKSSNGVEATTTHMVTVGRPTEESESPQNADGTDDDSTITNNESLDITNDESLDNGTAVGDEEANNSTVADNEARKSSTTDAVDDQSSTDGSEAVDNDETESETPGFGVVVATLSLVGGALGASRRSRLDN